VRKIWRVWKYTLGSFSDEKTQRYDNAVAIFRSIIFITYLATNCFIISGVIRHWHDLPSELHETQEKGLCKATSILPKN
jgi:hypothetical protein|tara:strand:- start:1161 stop:1397 length:237 start_codon:yes stop_codon:yes gene_type:complete